MEKAKKLCYNMYVYSERGNFNMIFDKKIKEIYKSQLFARYDDRGVVKYFTHSDFPGLHAQGFSFKSSKGNILRGNFYSYGNFDKKELVIFDHGLGGGHLSYMKEIEKLASQGYKVFSYDHTGCMASEGDGVGGFSSSLSDLNDCICALKADSSVNTDEIYVMGHSFGGLSTLNISALHKEVKKIVVISGPVSVKQMINQNFPGPLALYRKGIMQIERESNPKYVDYDAVETLANSGVKAILIYSDNDSLVKKKYHYDALYSAFSKNENIEFILENGKGHNPNYTPDAVSYLGELFAALKKNMPKTVEEKRKFKNSFDWNRMTAQDDQIWKRIFEFLEK